MPAPHVEEMPDKCTLTTMDQRTKFTIDYQTGPFIQPATHHITQTPQGSLISTLDSTHQVQASQQEKHSSVREFVRNPLDMNGENLHNASHSLSGAPQSPIEDPHLHSRTGFRARGMTLQSNFEGLNPYLKPDSSGELSEYWDNLRVGYTIMCTAMKQQGQDDKLKMCEVLFADYLEKQQNKTIKRDQEDKDERTKWRRGEEEMLERRLEEDRRIVREREAEDLRIHTEREQFDRERHRKREQDDKMILHKRKEEDRKTLELIEETRQEKAGKRRQEDLEDNEEYEANKRAKIETINLFVVAATDILCESLTRPRANRPDQGQSSKDAAGKQSDAGKTA